MDFDNYSSLPTCPHLAQVLAKARDNVLTTYRQAVSITQLSHASRCTSRKDQSEVPTAKLVRMKTAALACSECQVYHECNYICLQCPHVGCDVHTRAHFKSNHHMFGIDSGCGVMYCFACDAYTNHDALDSLRLGRSGPVANGSANGGANGSSGASSGASSSDAAGASGYTDPAPRAMAGLKGFVNLGATCFMSSILQTLIHNPLMKHYFVNNDLHYFNCPKNKAFLVSQSVDEGNACITCALDNIFTSFYTSASPEGFGLTHLLSTAWYKNNSLAGFQEQDAHEFWQFMLNEIHSDHELISEVANGHFKRDPDEQCACATHTTFGGLLESRIRCLSCDAVASTTDPVFDLSLELKKGATTVYDCLDLFCRDEKLDVAYACSSCGDKTNAVKSLRIQQAAPVFSIQLKRFKHNVDSYSKIDNPIEVPLYLDLAPYAHDPHVEWFYELFALVCHTGSVHTGHYVVICKDGDGQWFKFDDSVITMVSEQEVKQTSAYLLFYIRHAL
ncbi:ubiquitin carboxyl-terminal hydrolase 8 [Diutina catenulata]